MYTICCWLVCLNIPSHSKQAFPIYLCTQYINQSLIMITCNQLRLTITTGKLWDNWLLLTCNILCLNMKNVASKQANGNTTDWKTIERNAVMIKGKQEKGTFLYDISLPKQCYHGKVTDKKIFSVTKAEI